MTLSSARNTQTKIYPLTAESTRTSTNPSLLAWLYWFLFAGISNWRAPCCPKWQGSRDHGISILSRSSTGTIVDYWPSKFLTLVPDPRQVVHLLLLILTLKHHYSIHSMAFAFTALQRAIFCDDSKFDGSSSFHCDVEISITGLSSMCSPFVPNLGVLQTFARVDIDGWKQFDSDDSDLITMMILN